MVIDLPLLKSIIEKCFKKGEVKVEFLKVDFLKKMLALVSHICSLMDRSPRLEKVLEACVAIIYYMVPNVSKKKGTDDK